VRDVGEGPRMHEHLVIPCCWHGVGIVLLSRITDMVLHECYRSALESLHHGGHQRVVHQQHQRARHTQILKVTVMVLEKRLLCYRNGEVLDINCYHSARPPPPGPTRLMVSEKQLWCKRNDYGVRE
jgi:hypothetical protein